MVLLTVISILFLFVDNFTVLLGFYISTQFKIYLFNAINALCTVGSTLSFYYTGSYEPFTVPTDISSLTVQACGANGGSSKSSYGKGGCITCSITVTPYETLYVYVGGAASLKDNSGGYNGGGHGYYKFAGNGGGGASDLRQNGNALSNRYYYFFCALNCHFFS